MTTDEEIKLAVVRVQLEADGLLERLEELERLTRDTVMPGAAFSHLVYALSPIGELGKTILERDLVADLRGRGK